MIEFAAPRVAVVGTGFSGIARTHLPAERAEGFADTFREFYRAVYSDVARGGPSEDRVNPTFRDGYVENVLVDAVALSNRERRRVEVLA